jgi:hypothetical protein
MAEWTQEEQVTAEKQYDSGRFGLGTIRTYEATIDLLCQRNRALAALENAVGIMPDYACDEARAAIAACTEGK